MRTRTLLIAALFLVPAVTQAQTRFELRPFVGTYLPTGSQRDDLHDATLSGAQMALEAADRFHFVGTFGFAGPSVAGRLGVPGHVHIYAMDLGGEMFDISRLNENWELRPFVGLGGGVRTYDLTASGFSAKSYPAGYGAAGTEFQTGQFALRLEARDYVLPAFRGPLGNDSRSVRNEIALSAGVAYHLW